MAEYLGQISMRSGDSLPLLAVAVETDQGDPISLATATRADFLVLHPDGEDPRVNPGAIPERVLVLPGQIVNAAAGIVAYDWALDMPLRPGLLELILVVTTPTGPITAPTDRSARIVMRPRADP